MNEEAAEAALLDVDTNRRAALIAGDVEALAVLFSDSLAWIHSSGKAEDKAAILKGVARADLEGQPDPER